MRIAWFTPYSPFSAIAKCSRTIVTALAQRHEVEIWHFEEQQIRDAPVPVRRLQSPDDWDAARHDQYDLVVYNFGNYLPFHREIFLLSRRRPGICILHDFVMHHFFAAYYLEWLKDGEAYVSSMKRLYGSEGEKVARAAVNGAGGIWETERVGEFPLVEDIIQGAKGVIVHSEFLKTYISRTFGGPIKKLSLPYPIDDTPVATTRNALGVPEDCCLLLTVGHVNPNKCISDALEALGRVSAAGQRFAYAIVGKCDPKFGNELRRVADRHGISAAVHWMGEVNDETLRGFLRDADVCLNLRFPVIEGASASVIEQMKFGKAVIVSDTGFFTELPSDCVVKVEPKNVPALAQLLTQLVSSPGECAELGKRARQYAHNEFDVDRYAAGLELFAIEVQQAAPLLRVADRVAQEFRQMEVAGFSEVVKATARELYHLFCESSEK